MAGIFSKAALAALAFGLGAFSGASAQAEARFMQTGAITSQPIGHYEFCQKYRSECMVKSANTLPARVTEFGWETIKKINAEVNERVMPMTDLDIYGRDEVWAYPAEVGDCEDYVLEKRRELMKQGFSASTLLITVVRKPDGEGHAVLTVRTVDGDFILDNLADSVKIWTATPYRYMKRQADNDTGRWVKIENNTDVVVGSVNN